MANWYYIRQFEKIGWLNFEMYIKYEAFKGSPSFVENNDLDVHISSIRSSQNKLKMFKSL